MMRATVLGRHDGREVREVWLESGPTRIAVMGWGAGIRDWRLDGAPMVLGFERFEDYPRHSPDFGIVAGRVANRISHGRLRLGGREWQLELNAGRHHLHGGSGGFGRRVWDLEVDSAARAVRLTRVSPDGEAGYPGRVEASVTYRLEGARLVCEMRAVPDRPTPINLAQHNYYDLAGTGDIRFHALWLDADRCLPVDGELIPTGAVMPVAGTRFDFTRSRKIGARDPGDAGAGAADPAAGIYDHNLCLRAARDPEAPAAELVAAGRRLRIWTDQPGIQIYTAAGMSVAVPGLEGRRYGPFGGVCLEAQAWPDAPNRPGFPDIVRTPDMPYFQKLAVEISDRA